MDLSTWPSEALRHCLWLHKRAGREYAIWSADESEKGSAGALKDLGKRVREEIEKREAAVAAKEA